MISTSFIIGALIFDFVVFSSCCNTGEELNYAGCNCKNEIKACRGSSEAIFCAGCPINYKERRVKFNDRTIHLNNDKFRSRKYKERANGVLVVTDIQQEDAGTYKYRNIRKSHYITCWASLKLSNCESIVVSSGSDVNLTCEVGDDSHLEKKKLYWQRLDNDHSSPLKLTRNGKVTTLANSAFSGRLTATLDLETLKIINTRESDAGNYTCIVPTSKPNHARQIYKISLSVHTSSTEMSMLKEAATTFNFLSTKLIVVNETQGKENSMSSTTIHHASTKEIVYDRQTESTSSMSSMLKETELATSFPSTKLIVVYESQGKENLMSSTTIPRTKEIVYDRQTESTSSMSLMLKETELATSFSFTKLIVVNKTQGKENSMSSTTIPRTKEIVYDRHTESTSSMSRTSTFKEIELATSFPSTKLVNETQGKENSMSSTTIPSTKEIVYDRQIETTSSMSLMLKETALATSFPSTKLIVVNETQGKENSMSSTNIPGTKEILYDQQTESTSSMSSTFNKTELATSFLSTKLIVVNETQGKENSMSPTTMLRTVVNQQTEAISSMRSVWIMNETKMNKEAGMLPGTIMPSPKSKWQSILVRQTSSEFSMTSKSSTVYVTILKDQESILARKSLGVRVDVALSMRFLVQSYLMMMMISSFI